MTDLLIPIAPGSAHSLHRQVYLGIRDAILSGRLGAGAVVPSSRKLAQDLEVSRSTVLVAFEQLISEGYIVGAQGSGSYVAKELPDHLLHARRLPKTGAVAPVPAPRLSNRGKALRDMPRHRPHNYPNAFVAGIPPIDQFPLAVWSRIATRRYRMSDRNLLYHGQGAGFLPLRTAIAAHLSAARGMRCSAEQIIVMTSAQEAMELASRVLIDPGDSAWIEEPSWAGARGALLAAGANIVPVPVDAEGLDVSQGITLAPHARLAYVSPSHQYPLGMTMSLERRLTLLDWAARNNAWIIEDDYDSDIRYSGRPLTALAGLDAAGRVLYVGTFNKTLFPSLRVGYLVVPESVTDDFLSARRIGGQHVSTMDQAILTDFIADGHFGRHLRRMRTLCHERRDLLLASARRFAGGVLNVAHAETGLQTIGWLAPGIIAQHVTNAAAEKGVEAAPLSAHYAGAGACEGLILGYAGLTDAKINAAMKILAEVARSCKTKA